jgi:hypothetical protein
MATLGHRNKKAPGWNPDPGACGPLPLRTLSASGNTGVPAARFLGRRIPPAGAPRGGGCSCGPSRWPARDLDHVHG